MSLIGIVNSNTERGLKQVNTDLWWMRTVSRLTKSGHKPSRFWIR